MITHFLVKKDPIIYWEKVAVDDEGEPVFARPIMIKGRWDIVQHESQLNDVIEVEQHNNNVYPDRVVTVGGYMMLGTEEDLRNLSFDQRKNPRLLPNARKIQSQSVVFELGWKQSNVKPGYQDKHMTVEIRVG